MKKIFLLFLLFSICSFSQEKDFNYHFDYFTKVNVKFHGDKINEDTYIFKNSKDSTYSLELRYSKTDTIAQIFDKKVSDIIKFDIDFKFEKISDLEKLKKPILYTSVTSSSVGKKFKNFHQEIEYEHDTINNKIIVHITQFKNNKKKKIINEHYYFYSNNNLIKPLKKSKYNFKLSEDNELQIPEDYSFEKSICIVDGKISSEYLIYKIEKIDYNFKFSVIKTIR